MKDIGNVISFFDGMSCLQIALNRQGIKYDKYFASEINKNAIKVTQANYPNTIQLGDIQNISGYDLPKIDFIGCGSPCQGFSFAGNRLQFEDPRSKLFFEAVRIMNECREKNPDIKFIFENVRMGLKNGLIFSKYLGVEPILINSRLVSAQNRERWYWTNIAAVPQNLFGDMKTTIPNPKDKMLRIRDILEESVSDKYYLSEKALRNLLGSLRGRISELSDEKFGALLANQAKQGTDMLCVRQINPSTRTLIGKSIRRLTPIECERLQTVPENYTNHVAETHRYAMLGNGWTIDVICHILSYL